MTLLPLEWWAWFDAGSLIFISFIGLFVLTFKLASFPLLQASFESSLPLS